MAGIEPWRKDLVMSDTLLTKYEVSARLRISQRTLDRLREEGKLPWLAVGTGKKPSVRFRAEDLEEFERQARQAGKAHVDV